MSFDPKSPGGPWHGAKKAIMNLAVDGMFYFGIERAAHVEHLRVHHGDLAAASASIAGVPVVGHFGKSAVWS